MLHNRVHYETVRQIDSLRSIARTCENIRWPREDSEKFSDLADLSATIAAGRLIMAQNRTVMIERRERGEDWGDRQKVTETTKRKK